MPKVTAPTTLTLDQFIEKTRGRCLKYVFFSTLFFAAAVGACLGQWHDLTKIHRDGDSIMAAVYVFVAIAGLGISLHEAVFYSLRHRELLAEKCTSPN